MEAEITGLPEQIIQYQKKHDLTDNEMAFQSHLSVERLHDIKSGDQQATANEQQRLLLLIQA